VAISVAWQTVVTVGTAQTSNSLYTVPASTASSFAYARDLVCTNSGAATILVGLTTSASPAATTTGSFEIPAGGTLLLTQCQVPNGTASSTSGVISACTLTTVATSQLSIGFATNVAYI
jgi:hypothetical protein